MNFQPKVDFLSVLSTTCESPILEIWLNRILHAERNSSRQKGIEIRGQKRAQEQLRKKMRVKNDTTQTRLPAQQGEVGHK